MMARTQVTLPPEQHRRARSKAAELGVSLAEYVRRLIAADLEERPRQQTSVSEIFGIGRSGGSDVAQHKDDYLADALDALHPRR